MKRKVLTLLCAALAGLCVVASPVSARWSYGQGASDIDLNVLPPPATYKSVCATHIDGRAGLSTGLDPSGTPPPSGPYPGVTVELYAVSPAVWDGVHRQGDQLVTADGTPLTPVAVLTTAPATALNPPEEYDVGGIWVYAAAPFSFTPPPGSINPGDVVIVRQPGRPADVSATAVACATPPIGADIDVLPGLAGNPVIPSLRLPVLPVRVFGSASLDVTKIDSVKLGNAAPVATLPGLAQYFSPRDRNGDGLLDRDYLFVPSQTGIACGDTSVTLTGSLSGGGTFSGTDSIRTVGCR